MHPSSNFQHPAAGRLHPTAGAALVVLLAGAYLASWPPDITFEDTPIFAAACYSRGLAHPPGYPLHTLLCWPLAQLADFLPISIAQASALASLIPAIGACLLLARLASVATGCPPAGLLAAGLLGLAPGFWNQAIIPESYALNAFLIAAAWSAADAYVRAQQPRMLIVLALCIGLGLANHWPLFLLPAPALLLWLLPARRQLRTDLGSPHLLAAIAAALAAGLLPYLHLLFPAEQGYRFFAQEPEEGFFWYVSRQAYSSDELAGASRNLAEMGLVLLMFAKQYAYVFAAAGLVALGWMRRRGQLWPVLAVLWAVCSCTLVLLLVRPLAPGRFMAAEIFAAYPLPAYLWFALPIAVAIALFFSRLIKCPIRQWVCCALVLIVCALVRFPGIDRSLDDVAAVHAQRLLASLPEDSTLLVPKHDFYLGINYMQQIGAARPDVRLLGERELFVQLDRAMQLGAEQQQQLADLAPVAFISDLQLAQRGRTWRGSHFLFGGSAAGTTAVKLDEEARQYYRQLIAASAAGHYSNGWTRRFVAETISDLARHLAGAAGNGQQQPVAADLQLLELARQLPAGRYGSFIAVATGSRATPQQVVQDALLMEEEFPVFYPQWRARVLYISGYAFFLQGDVAAAADLFEQSLAQFPSEDNFRALIDLLQVYAFMKRFDDYRELRMRFAGFDPGAALKGQDAACARHFAASCTADVKESES